MPGGRVEGAAVEYESQGGGASIVDVMREWSKSAGGLAAAGLEDARTRAMIAGGTAAEQEGEDAE